MSDLTAADLGIDLDPEPDLSESELGYQPDGRPTLMTLANAVQCWALSQGRREVTFGEAALAFNIAPERVAQAVELHCWLFTLDTDRPLVERRIGHEGE